MSWQWWCALLGLILVTGGALLAFTGVKKTRSDFIADEKFWRALTIWLPRWWGKSRTAFVADFNRFIRPKKLVRLDDHAFAVSTSASLEWDVLLREFPEGDELCEVVRRLWKRQSDFEPRLGDAILKTGQKLTVAQEDLVIGVAGVDEKVVKVAVGGLSLQAWASSWLPSLLRSALWAPSPRSHRPIRRPGRMPRCPLTPPVTPSYTLQARSGRPMSRGG